LSGATHVKASKLIAKLNQRGMTQMQVLLSRGQTDGTIRTDILPLDVYMHAIGLCYYHVANRAGYVAGGLIKSEKTATSDAFHTQRKRAVIEAVTRYAMVI
jgi:Tetracyclin repressor-like, C-terminal domain